MIEQIAAPALAAWLKDDSREAPVLLDVREGWEFAHCALPGAVSLPMGAVPQRIEEIDRERDIVCICHHGMRSQRVAMFLASQGFTRLYNLVGGVHAWSQEVDPSMPTY